VTLAVGTASGERGPASSGATGEINARNIGRGAGGYLQGLAVDIFRGAQFWRRAVANTAAHRERRDRVDSEKYAAGRRSGIGKARRGEHGDTGIAGGHDKRVGGTISVSRAAGGAGGIGGRGNETR